ncbi:aminotransferase class I/II-fold pyridoxal phosphate-dependent enzyme [Natronomonas sp. F2-12]|jgi:aspartate aminotransferase|uniref:Aminotransferase n=1 Tax=Natronomonas aquatica TaxID=2841590 RepID=A0A9R1CVA0_9EURY|nr:aminotransferase class I/II-fold pyridoxal phosphate-dependent enzyme [Natronomonas aquatica]MCQ4334392.1 aminotransferase class I/II-fold pyridoxal phosphate-dependent enzyme [Natronomonas aquatica]
MKQHHGRKRISRRVDDIEPQKIRVMFDLAAEYDGDLVHLELGEPDFDTPGHIVEAAHEAATAGATRYTPNAGLLELREAIAERLSEQTGQNVDPGSEVVVTNGGVEALHLAIHTVADPGEEVLIPTPAWPNPISQAKLAGAVPIEVSMPPEAGFEPDPDTIIDAIGQDTAAVSLTSPSNPTGRVFPPEAIERIVEAAAEHGAYVLADEVYRNLTYGETPARIRSVTDHDEWVLSVDSFSKTYAMTGWRVGWLSGPADVLGEVTKIHESTTSCVNAPAQHAAIAALTGSREPIEAMKDAFRSRRDFVVDRIGSIPHVSVAPPEGGFYAFLDVSALEGSSMEIAKRLLYDYQVVTAPGVAFGDGGEGHIRLSFANDRDRIATGLDRLESMIRTELGPA